MSADFEHNEWNDRPATGGASTDPTLPSVKETLKRDRCELLSAYLDGEVTADERRQVETWLTTDPAMKQLHARLLKLRQDMQLMPVPPCKERQTEETIERVFERLDRRPRRWAMAGGMAIAAMFVGAITSVLSPDLGSPTHQLATTTPDDGTTAELKIALDSPIIEIPSITDPQSTPLP